MNDGDSRLGTPKVISQGGEEGRRTDLCGTAAFPKQTLLTYSSLVKKIRGLIGNCGRRFRRVASDRASTSNAGRVFSSGREPRSNRRGSLPNGRAPRPTARRPTSTRPPPRNDSARAAAV